MTQELAATESKGKAGWQPIETAEEDGLDIVVAFFRENGTEYARKRIVRVEERAWPKQLWYMDQQQRVFPSHWAPIPPPLCAPER